MPVEMTVDVEPASTAEEGFFQASRQQAEDRFNRSVVRVQALFRCHRAQHGYGRMRIAHEEAKVCLLLSSILIYIYLWVDDRACENAWCDIHP